VPSETIEQELQVLDVEDRAFVTEPLLQGAVEALELAQGLRVGGTGVDELDPDLPQLTLEGDLDPEQAAGEDAAVIGEELAGKSVDGGSACEAAPGRIPARACASERAEQVASVVVQAVDDPCFRPSASVSSVASICQRSLGTREARRARDRNRRTFDGGQKFCLLV